MAKRSHEEIDLIEEFNFELMRFTDWRSGIYITAYDQDVLHAIPNLESSHKSQLIVDIYEQMTEVLKKKPYKIYPKVVKFFYRSTENQLR